MLMKFPVFICNIFKKVGISKQEVLFQMIIFNPTTGNFKTYSFDIEQYFN